MLCKEHFVSPPPFRRFLLRETWYPVQINGAHSFLIFQRAVDLILSKWSEGIDVQKRDGWTAFHLATANNHYDSARNLLKHVSLNKPLSNKLKKR